MITNNKANNKKVNNKTNDKKEKKNITIIGAGISGLTTAYYLAKKGHKIEIFEKNDQPGGLIKTIRDPHGIVETAANGFLNSPSVEKLFNDLELPFLPQAKLQKKKFIFRKKPKKVPFQVLSPFEFIITFTKIFIGFIKGKKFLSATPYETVKQWGKRVLGQAGTNYLLSPLFQGVYAGNLEEMSAFLILNPYFNQQKNKTQNKSDINKTKIKGTVCPPKGMFQVIEKLVKNLEKMNVKIHYNYNFSPLNKEKIKDKNNFFIIATSTKDSSQIISSISPHLSEELNKVHLLPIISVYLFFPSSSDYIVKGYGCLFPRNENILSLGVLCNNNIYQYNSTTTNNNNNDNNNNDNKSNDINKKNSNLASERWILGGALHQDLIKLSDKEIIELVLKDRKNILETQNRKEIYPIKILIQRYDESFPYFNLQLEKARTYFDDLPDNVKLIGNYTGQIGLKQIIVQILRLSEEI